MPFSNHHGGRRNHRTDLWRIFLATTSTFFFTFFLVSSFLPRGKPTLSSWETLSLDSTSPHGQGSKGHLLILTPLKNAAKDLPEYFDNLVHLDYPKSLISLAFLVSDTEDDTIKILEKYAKALTSNNKEQDDDADRYYSSFLILTKDFHISLSATLRHSYEFQPIRRSFLARSRNYLLSSALRPHHDWVLWLDSDVVRYDPNILDDLMEINKDVVVPNCLWMQKEGWDFWGYDRNNWAETEESLEILSKLDPDYVLVEGYHEFPTKRLHLVDMPTHLGKHYVPLDGIGATFALVNARVHREGANFPAYPFENAIETEGFAKMARKMGFEVVGVPGILVFHARNN